MMTAAAIATASDKYGKTVGDTVNSGVDSTPVCSRVNKINNTAASALSESPIQESVSLILALTFKNDSTSEASKSTKDSGTNTVILVTADKKPGWLPASLRLKNP
jgi:hypothetical protein